MAVTVLVGHIQDWAFILRQCGALDCAAGGAAGLDWRRGNCVDRRAAAAEDFCRPDSGAAGAEPAAGDSRRPGAVAGEDSGRAGIGAGGHCRVLRAARGASGSPLLAARTIEPDCSASFAARGLRLRFWGIVEGMGISADCAAVCLSTVVGGIDNTESAAVAAMNTTLGRFC